VGYAHDLFPADLPFRRMVVKPLFDAGFRLLFYVLVTARAAA
jgi:hypothetical protein